MYPAVTLSLACLAMAVIIGIIVWMGLRARERRKREHEETIKRQIAEFTGEDFIRGRTTVGDLERKYGKKG